MKILPKNLFEKKSKGVKIAALTCYDFSFAKIFGKAEIDVLLVGDSLSNVILGNGSTKEIGMKEIIHHTRGVSKGAKNSLVVADMPFNSYNSPKNALKNAKLLIEAGADAVKLEGHVHNSIVAIVKEGIPVMGHLGFLPQSMEKPKLIGKTPEEYEEILFDAIKLERDGCFAIVLECVLPELAKHVSETLSIPTIGINSGKDCDGQILVSYDLLGLYPKSPCFVKKYVDFSKEAETAVKKFRKEIEKGKFPK